MRQKLHAQLLPEMMMKEVDVRILGSPVPVKGSKKRKRNRYIKAKRRNKCGRDLSARLACRIYLNWISMFCVNADI